jgi:hypothetical protein
MSDTGGYESVACPVCPAEAGEQCRGMTLAAQYAWGVHSERADRWWAREGWGDADE